MYFKSGKMYELRCQPNSDEATVEEK